MGACVSKNGKRKVKENSQQYKKSPANKVNVNEIRRKRSRTPSVPSPLIEEPELETILGLQTEKEEIQNTESNHIEAVEPKPKETSNLNAPLEVTSSVENPDKANITIEIENDVLEIAEPPTPHHLSPKEKIRFRRDFFLKDILNPPSNNSYQANIRNSEVILRNNSANGLNGHFYSARETYPVSKITPPKPKRQSLGQVTTLEEKDVSSGDAKTIEHKELEDCKQAVDLENAECANGKKEDGIVKEKDVSSGILEIAKLKDQVFQNGNTEEIISKVTVKLDAIDDSIKSQAVLIN
ncbi:uncharacterized protein LOC126738433 [Anthonomus grandis grandis]|uniref:uncharacterized protein LOC126738433 n=1 Tax=Anthonomus grandis grandis TaxID=2921223 RepID=UPI002165E3F0|nr:uncharacterized protein LOC126738433 [Anthonomus grandis grandis]XP_050299739.1 uncharacterized protein LOC126738433 [Anthonomus grandis grandis]